MMIMKNWLKYLTDLLTKPFSILGMVKKTKTSCKDKFICTKDSNPNVADEIREIDENGDVWIGGKPKHMGKSVASFKFVKGEKDIKVEWDKK